MDFENLSALNFCGGKLVILKCFDFLNVSDVISPRPVIGKSEFSPIRIVLGTASIRSTSFELSRMSNREFGLLRNDLLLLETVTNPLPA